MTAQMLQHYTRIVEFLGRVLGPDYEIALHEVGRRSSRVAAIVNGHVSGRTVGAPLTNVAEQLIASRAYEREDWLLNYRGVSAEGRVLRCSTLFLKDEHGELQGLLCINFDDSRYRELSERVFALCHPDAYASSTIAIRAVPFEPGSGTAEQEVFYNSVSAATEAALRQVLPETLHADRLTGEEKLELVRQLEARGIFARKGAVAAAAKSLNCSQASIYRYLKRLRQD